MVPSANLTQGYWQSQCLLPPDMFWSPFVNSIPRSSLGFKQQQRTPCGLSHWVVMLWPHGSKWCSTLGNPGRFWPQDSFTFLNTEDLKDLGVHFHCPHLWPSLLKHTFPFVWGKVLHSLDWSQVGLCAWGWPWTPNLPACSSQVLRLQVWIIIPDLKTFFFLNKGSRDARL